MKKSPLIIGGLLLGGFLLSSSNKSSIKKDDGKCGCFTPLFILNKNCTIIEKINPKYDVIKDFEKIDKYVKSLGEKGFDVEEITKMLLTKKYGYCLKQDFDKSVYQYLYITQFADTARALYLFEHINCEEYKELMFDYFRLFLKQKGISTPYIDNQGIIVKNDNIIDEQIIWAFTQEMQMFKTIDWLSKDSECLAISVLLSQYLQNELDVMIYDWSLENQETLKRFERYIHIINQAKLKVKQNG